MTNNQAKELWESLWECSDVKGAKFAYAVLKNRDKLTSYLKTVAENPIVADYEKKRMDTAEELAEKDEEGNSIKTKNMMGKEEYKFTDRKEFEKQVMETPERKAFEEYMESEAGVELHIIKKEDISPEITANQLGGIKLIIEE